MKNVIRIAKIIREQMILCNKTLSLKFLSLAFDDFTRKETNTILQLFPIRDNFGNIGIIFKTQDNTYRSIYIINDKVFDMTNYEIQFPTTIKLISSIQEIYNKRHFMIKPKFDDRYFIVAQDHNQIQLSTIYNSEFQRDNETKKQFIDRLTSMYSIPYANLIYEK